MTDDLRDYYLRALPGRIDALESSLDAAGADADARAAVRRIAHSMKGSGASYGFPRISEVAAFAESASDAELADRVGALVAVLRATVADAAGAESVVRILVVDDDPDVVHLLRSVLEGPGRVVTAAGDVASAEQALSRDKPSLIVLDLLLPDGDGRSLLMRMRERPTTASTPIIVLTATSSERARAECIALGADLVVPKPFDPALLAASVRQQIQRTEQVRQATHRDPLTGLANRAAFAEAWAAISQDGILPVLVGVLDLDHFKEVNDAFGHNRGDAVLQRFAALATESLPHARAIARWGGEEFAVVYAGDHALRADAEIRDLLARTRTEPFEFDGRNLQVTVSGGLADASGQLPLDEAIARADYFLYLAKATGRDRLVTSEEGVAPPTRRILLAEDDELTASLILHRLRREGFDVDHHRIGTDALAAARSARYALAILDVKMPGMDGFELLRELRSDRNFRDTPILMLTSMGSEEDVVRGFELGATDYVLKPFSPVELVARVQRHLRKH